MPSKEKADLHRIGSKENHSTGKSKRSLTDHYSRFPPSVQWRNCGSAYIRFAIDGGCEQRAEYLRREKTDRVKASKESGGQIR